MSQPALRLVEGSSMDKSKALSAALSQIERQFGKGSIMKLGKNDKSMDSRLSTGPLGSMRRGFFPEARFGSTSRSASAACRAAAW